jgi:hypothetical protein
MNTIETIVRKPAAGRLNHLFAAALLSLSLAPQAAPSAAGAASVEVASVAARPEDVSSVEGLMRAFYEVVNVRPDAPRQWGRDRTLYSPWIRFVATSTTAAGQPKIEVWDHQQLVDGS